jgi:transketolase N-terminal domain/subunit
MIEQATIPAMDIRAAEPAPDEARLMRQGLLKLLDIKDSDIRILTLEQCRDAVDKGLHSGGAFSAVIPLVALYYGGFLDPDVANPTTRGQDMFVLSKGHAVATMASIYAELGYFDRQVLVNSRSYESILNGHPGPILPGVHISTGPLGQGLSVAQGFALAGKSSPRFDVYCMTGDGELQEGLIWEAVMYAAYKRLDNLCVLVDNNNGQLDIVDRLIFPLPDLEAVFRSFGWNVEAVDATQYDGVVNSLDRFKYAGRNGKPTAIVCRTTKGHGGFSNSASWRSRPNSAATVSTPSRNSSTGSQAFRKAGISRRNSSNARGTCTSTLPWNREDSRSLQLWDRFSPNAHPAATKASATTPPICRASTKARNTPPPPSSPPP